MLPKKIYKKIDYNETPIKSPHEYMKYGFDRIRELMYRTDKKTVYLPRSIDFFDLDDSIFELFNSGVLNLTLDGKEVPVIYMDNERWGEFSKTWKLMDEDNNVPTPYITIRRIGKGKGTRSIVQRVPQKYSFTYLDLPIIDEGQLINLRFKMPTPINVDLTYEVSLFTKYREDVNDMDKKILKEYSSTQLYVDVKGSYFPTKLESMDESNTLQNIDDEKLIVGKYTILLMGAIRDEEEYEIVKTSRNPNFKISL